MRIIKLSTYYAHTEPLFKHSELLPINKLFDLNCLKFVFNYKKRRLPSHFSNFRCTTRSSIHEHDTRFADVIDPEMTRTVMAGNCIRHHLVTVLNCTPQCILDKNRYAQPIWFYLLYQAILLTPVIISMLFKSMLCLQKVNPDICH